MSGLQYNRTMRKKNMKQLRQEFISAVLISSLPFMMTVIPVHAEEPSPSVSTTTALPETITLNGVTYELDETAVPMSARAVSFDNTTSEIEIPDSVADSSARQFIVTAIAEDAFKNAASLKRVSLGANVASIGTSAFQGCTDVESRRSRKQREI